MPAEFKTYLCLVDKYIEMLNKRVLNRINERPRGRGLAIYAASGVVALSLLLALFSYALAAAALLAGAGLVFLLHKRDIEARTVCLIYLEPGEAPEFDAARVACETLSGAQKVWRLDGDAWKRVEKSSDDKAVVLDASCRYPVEVGLLETPGISANVDIWGINTGAATLFFLPECVLLYKEDIYRAVPYDSLSVAYRASRTLEDGEVPGDAKVVGETWRFVKADGGPDLRYPNNPKSTVAGYGLLSLAGVESREIRLLVSDKTAALRFARAFGFERDEDSARKREESVSEESMSSLLDLLDLGPGASREDINLAYKRKAKMYHPDLVANMAPEVREMAELRMKELNAAYSELKR